MSAPLVSVVVPCHNYGRYLAECVDSIRAQSIPDLEIVIVDDGSSDETRAVAARFADARVRVLRHAVNQGLIAALTTGLGAARGRYIARIDADDRYRPYFLEEAIAIFDRYPDVGLVYGDVAAIDPSGRVTEDPWPGLRSRAAHAGQDSCADEFLANVEDNVIPAAAMIARRDAYLAALPFPDWFKSQAPSDWYLNIRIARAHPVYYRARTMAEYRLHPTNMHRQGLVVASYEQTVLHVLSEVFSGTDRRDSKRAIKRRVYARAYLSFARQYFAARQYADARRCYLRAVSYRPDMGLQWDPLRHLAGTVIGPEWYARLKRTVRRPPAS